MPSLFPMPRGFFAALMRIAAALAALALTPASFAQDDHGSTLSTATPITAGIAVAGQLQGDADRDLFKVVLPSAGTFTAQTTSTLDTYGTLYNAAGPPWVNNDDSGEAYNFALSRAVSAGTYYVLVRGYYASTTGSYTLTTTFTPNGTTLPASLSVTGLNNNPITTGSAPSTANGTDFGAVALTDGARTLTLRLANTGQAPLGIQNVALTGAGAAHFTVASTPATTIAPGAASSFQVRFDPSTLGTHDATITVSTDVAAQTSFTIALRGQGTETTPPPPPGNDDANAILTLVNQARAAQGLSALTLNTQLTQAATAHANDMAQNNFFSHTGSDGSNVGTRVTRTGYAWNAVGENIASGQRSAQEVHTAWMNSTGHRANILNANYAHLGLARVGNIWVQVFGRSR